MKWGALFLVFMVGVLIGSLIATKADLSNLSYRSQKEIPQGNQARERNSPGDWIKQSQIHVYNDKVVIDISNPQWASFVNTNSMDPVFDESANALQIIPQSAAEIHVGDIISYTNPNASGIIIHRVIAQGSDEQGNFFLVKGDNNPDQDPGKVRFSQIKKVLVGIIY